MKISAVDLTQGYDEKNVLESIDLEACTGEVMSILGPNGSGKSTLIRTMCNLMEPKSGKIRVGDVDIKDYDRKELAKTIGYVPQYYAYIQHMTVLDTVLLGRKPYVEWNYSDNDFRIAEDSMKRLRVLNLAERNVNELSGGQMQRVFIARALCQRPKFYMFDEPTSSLDLKHQIDTMKIMREIVHKEDSGMVIALHDLNLALRYSDKVVMIKDKKVYDCGPPESVITERSILDVYGVRSQILENDNGMFVLPVDSCGW